MKRFQALSKLQKGILLLLAAMLLIFSALYPYVLFRKGFLFRDTILTPRQENGNTIYSGNIHGEAAVFTVSADRTIRYTYGSTEYGPYRVREAPEAVPKNHELSDSMTGVEVLCGEELLFRGGVLNLNMDQEASYWLFNDDGSCDTISFNATHDDSRDALDPMAPSATTIVTLFYGPELTHKGTGLGWIFGVLLCVHTTISILYVDELFRWSLSFLIRNAEHAEPSEFEITCRYLEWIIFPILALVIFIMGLQ